MIIVDAPSPNFGPRKEGKKIKYLILHYTGTRPRLKRCGYCRAATPRTK